MRVEKREFEREFSQLSCSGQTKRVDQVNEQKLGRYCNYSIIDFTPHLSVFQ